MTTNAATIGFQIARVQQQIIELEYQQSLLLTQDKQKLEALRKTLQTLRQNYDIDLED
ncbi:MAG: hypothetical protein MUD14_13995 [Hydrococcus sp. Prado102]|jgi:hypothetical protein|nr:hypothetical protein [Hydrococcus sp. Prado102]